MSDLKLSHSLFPLLLFIFSINGQTIDFAHPSCPAAFNCNNVTFRYPFWRIVDEPTPQFCGYRGFGINCSSVNISSIALGADSYYVKKINYESRSIVLVDNDVVNNSSCPRVRHIIELETLALNFSTWSVNLSFHFNCTGGTRLPADVTPIGCLDYNQRRSFVNIASSELENFDWDCEQEVVTTVFQDADLQLPSHWETALSRGFELNWWREDDCEKCEDSYGRCGRHNATGFICFCPNGTATKGDCNATMDIHLLITIILFANISISLGTNSSSCLTQNCGNGPNITFPFWIPRQQEPSCGSPQFNITCKDGYPILVVSNHDYVIKDIFYNNHSLLLVTTEAFDQNNLCPVPLSNFSIDGRSAFAYTILSVDLYFFYNCRDPYNRKTYSVDCATNGTNFSSFAVFHPEILAKNNYSCQRAVHVPVHVDALNVLLYENYTDVLRNGFVLEWQCSNCDNHGSGINLKIKLLIGFVSAGFGIFVMCVVFFFWRRHNIKKRYYDTSYKSRNVSSYKSSVTDTEKNGTYHGVQIFKYRELEKATNHFYSANELGDGGFGTVYKGKLKDGRVVAVKRLYENNYKRVEQFMNEVGILAHLRHQNLVSLYGCTTHHSRELLLVYEYIPNGTVADHLHGEKSKPGSLTWTTRMSIAIETASALVYLHASDVVHRDVKTNNILLDNSFAVKVADFGLSRLFPNNVTHVSTAPQGTPGYVDPEYHECYQLTSKSDVYSFGVVLMELISSKPAVDITRHRHEINLSNMALNKMRNDALHELVDPNLGFESDYDVRKMINAVAELSFQCLQNDRDCRPSMDEVLEGLLAIQNGRYSKEKNDGLDGSCDDAVLLKDHSQTMSPDSVAIAWSTSTISTSSA